MGQLFQILKHSLVSGPAAVADDVVIVSCISETQIKTTCCVDSVREEDDDGKVFLHLEVPLTHLLMCLKCFFPFSSAGFRLFSTSVPGQTAEDRPAPARRRPAPSSRFLFLCGFQLWIIMMFHHL